MNKAARALLESHFDTIFTAPDGIKKLRELILTLAMQGKLVAQDPNDPPASQLLKEIEAEKKRLVKEGKIKAPKPLPEISAEEVPYALPQGWEWVRLGAITSKITDGDHKTPPRTSAGFRLLSAKNVRDGYLDFDNCDFISEQHYLKSRERCCPDVGDLLIVSVGGTIGRTSLVPDDSDFALVRSVALIKPLLFNSSYLKHAMDSSLLQNSIHSRKRGGAQPCLYLSEIEQFIFSLPPLPEQHRIVAKIDQLMARCDELEKLRDEREQKRRSVHTAALKQLLLDASTSSFPRRRESSCLEALDSRLRGNDDSFADAWQFITQHFGELYAVRENVTELRKAILQLAVMGKLVPQNPNDPPASQLLKEIEAEKKRLVKEGKIKAPKQLPEIKPEEVPYALSQGWEWVRLNDALDVRDGTHDTPKYVDSGYPLITSKNIYTGKLSFDDVKYISEEDHQKISARSKVDAGDILFAMIGSIGNPVIVECDTEFSIKNVALFKYHLAGKPDNRYLHYFLTRAQENMKAISSGAVQSFVSLGFLRAYLLPLPPIAEQHRIVAKIDSLMLLCDALEQQIDAATRKRTALLDAVMAQV